MGLQKLKIDPNRSPRSEHEFGNIKTYDNINASNRNHQDDDDDDDDHHHHLVGAVSYTHLTLPTICSV
eukprot:9873851-Karenia_brevis.AAC.1